MSREIKVCPFCGGKACIYDNYSLSLGFGHYVTCASCEMHNEFQDLDSKINRWNSRPEEDRLNARIKELEEQTQWQPMETAPTNNEFLAVCLEDYTQVIYPHKIANEVYYRSVQSDKYVIPTLWMPLVKPLDNESQK